MRPKMSLDVSPRAPAYCLRTGFSMLLKISPRSCCDISAAVNRRHFRRGNPAQETAEEKANREKEAEGRCDGLGCVRFAAWGLCKCHVQCLAHDTRFLTFLPEQGWKRPLDRKNEPAGQPSELADA